MSVWSWVRERMAGRTTGPSAEVCSGRSEDTGGTPDTEAADRHSTTGTTPNDVFVGRVAGDDPGYLETGAEKRAEPDTGEGDETTTST
ncbi:hypothetical protein GCM10010261_38850 [Streptomyces pilosus]|uniref:Uncharacterized protein n=2 Tax=Streptomyces pilosus TaxID=28893 RepID=A0A918BJD5_9ACTN|nr:hypothetical protein GCM10010280_15960 [Streptomyces pilosus]GGV55135.1 hypothetical protein GCM10010261_38850 [Streptomyces pilosus]